MTPLHSLIFARDLPTAPKIVLLCLSEHLNKKTMECWPSHKLLAAEAGLSVSSVKRALDFLEELKVVSKEYRLNVRGGASSNCYTLHREVIENLPLVHSEPRVAHGDLPMNLSINLPTEPNNSSRYFVPRGTAIAEPSEEINLMRYEEDQGPDVTNPFASPNHPAGKGRGPRNGREISTWNNLDVAQEFADQATRFYPMMPNRCNIPALAKNLKLDRERSNATAAMHVAMIDAFFFDRRRIKDNVPLWQQFSGALVRLQERAVKTLDWDRDTRWGKATTDPAGTQRVLTPLEAEQQWLIDKGYLQPGETLSDDD